MSDWQEQAMERMFHTFLQQAKAGAVGIEKVLLVWYQAAHISSYSLERSCFIVSWDINNLYFSLTMKEQKCYLIFVPVGEKKKSF